MSEQQELVIAGIPIRNENDLAWAAHCTAQAALGSSPLAGRCCFCGARFFDEDGKNIAHIWRALMPLTNKSNHTAGTILLLHCCDCDPSNRSVTFGDQRWEFLLRKSPTWKTVQGEA